ncbi:hypothetical protein TEA_009957 [Camellia sinensis var. sinensis]|uniref:IBB domain-containing protein n=1 Tax=Camellia sinensis var. sinensis TaxID=542762 RepID=A0A4S4EGT1_CAMSN|nr:hypothetical protein TEA_009957 [Camellia sinensis var. sinensis]
MSLRPNSRTEVRKKSYKTGVDGDEARRRREDNLVEIRKNKREDNLLKKRREGLLLQSQQLSDASQTPAAIEKRVILVIPILRDLGLMGFLPFSVELCLVAEKMWEMGKICAFGFLSFSVVAIKDCGHFALTEILEFDLCSDLQLLSMHGPLLGLDWLLFEL